MSAETPSDGPTLPVSHYADRLAASLPATEKLLISPEPVAATTGPGPVVPTTRAGMPASVRGLLITLAAAFLLALAVIVVLLLSRGPASGVTGLAPATETPRAAASQPSSTPSASQPSVEASPVAAVPPAKEEPVAEADPVTPPAPVVPAPPVKVPLTEGILSFDARPDGVATIASACAAVLPKAAKQQDWVLLGFSWTTVGMQDGGEIQVNGTYGGASDLQGLEANSSVLFDLDCFTDNGTVKSTTYQLLMSTGTTRRAVQITLTGTGQTQEMTTLY